MGTEFWRELFSNLARLSVVPRRWQVGEAIDPVCPSGGESIL